MHTVDQPASCRLSHLLLVRCGTKLFYMFSSIQHPSLRSPALETTPSEPCEKERTRRWMEDRFQGETVGGGLTVAEIAFLGVGGVAFLIAARGFSSRPWSLVDRMVVDL